MKLFDTDTATQIEVAIQKRQQKEYKLIGSYVPKIDGYTIFEFNRETRKLTKATYRVSDEYILGGSNGRKLDVNKNCVYI